MADDQPGAGGRVRHIPVESPAELDGYHFARVVDGFDEHDRPRPWPGRPWVTDDAERDRLLAYLRAGAVVNRSDGASHDMFAPDRRWVVPTATFRTDGTWIWSDESIYYLDVHRLAPQPELYDHIAGNGYRCPVVEEEPRLAARSALLRWSELIAERRREYESRRTPPSLVRGEASNEPPTIPLDMDKLDQIETGTERFSSPVEATLLRAGWMPGRDAAARVDPWLDELCSRTDRLGRHLDVFGAARDIYREFGLLDLDAHVGPGEEMGAFAIHFFPADVTLDTGATLRFGERIGRRTLPIGDTDDDYSLLMVDEDGTVYLRHDTGTYVLGDTIDAALEMLVAGRRPVTLAEWRSEDPKRNGDGRG